MDISISIQNFWDKHFDIRIQGESSPEGMATVLITKNQIRHGYELNDIQFNHLIDVITGRQEKKEIFEAKRLELPPESSGSLSIGTPFSRASYIFKGEKDDLGRSNTSGDLVNEILDALDKANPSTHDFINE